MTSTLKHWSQIDPRTKYFVSFGDLSGYFYTGSPAGGVEQDPTTFTPSVSYGPNTMMKDLGRSVTVYNQTVLLGSKLTTNSIFRQVQLVKGANTGGVSGGVHTPTLGEQSFNDWKTFWIRVWAADGIVAPVARTG